MASPFIAGDASVQGNLPLARFLAPYSPGVASRRLSTHVPSGAWVLDPFGLDPFTALELARSGHRVLVTSNNPVTSFILEILASAPTRQELDDALQALANLRMSDEQRLEEYIRGYYRCTCPKCQETIEAESFIWQEGQEQASAMLINCPSCGLVGEQTLNSAELAAFKPLPSYFLHKTMGLEAAASPDDPLRPLMEEVIKYYSPRALILLQIVINKAKSPELSPRQKRLLQALLLSAADQVNQLWAYPLGKNRPKQLLRPPSFQEMNLWQALERAKQVWAQNQEDLILRDWPNLPPQSGGISLFKGRLRELQPQPDPKIIEAAYISLPRRNQAFWNLCGLWTAWLWGRDALEPLRHSLLRQRYDWTWHTRALEKVLSQLRLLIQDKTPILVSIGELEPLFLMAGILSAQQAALQLRSFAMDGEETSFQSIWDAGSESSAVANKAEMLSAARPIAREFLLDLGEPASYQKLFSAILLGLHTQGKLVSPLRSERIESLNDIEEELSQVFTDQNRLVRFNPGASVDTGSYWLKHPPLLFTPLADRVEAALIDLVQQQPNFSFDTLSQEINLRCPGLLTPENELVAACLNAYAALVEGGEGRWSLRPREAAQVRAGDLRQIREIIDGIGKSLGFESTRLEDGLNWMNADGSCAYKIFPMLSAQISPVLQKYQDEPGIKIIVLPGSRSNLVTYKLKRDPNLSLYWDANWRFVKFRQLRNISNNPLLTRELFASQISEDPPEFQSRQMVLF